MLIHLIFMYFLDRPIIMNQQFHFNLAVSNLIQPIVWIGIDGLSKVNRLLKRLGITYMKLTDYERITDIQ